MVVQGHAFDGHDEHGWHEPFLSQESPREYIHDARMFTALFFGWTARQSPSDNFQAEFVTLAMQRKRSAGQRRQDTYILGGMVAVTGGALFTSAAGRSHAAPWTVGKSCKTGCTSSMPIQSCSANCNQVKKCHTSLKPFRHPEERPTLCGGYYVMVRSTVTQCMCQEPAKRK